MCLGKSNYLKTLGKICFGVSFAASCFLGYSFDTNPSHNEKPNIIFIMVDDLGWRDVGIFRGRTS
jgi:hypothetical protein